MRTEPTTAAEVEDYVNYICPVAGADKVLEKSDPAVAHNPLIFPTEEDLAETFAFMSVDTKTRDVVFTYGPLGFLMSTIRRQAASRASPASDLTG